MQAKIRDAQLQKIPYMLVIGKREAEAGAVAVRLRNGRDLGAMPVAQFAEFASKLAESKALTLTPEVDTVRRRAPRRSARRPGHGHCRPRLTAISSGGVNERSVRPGRS